MEKGERGMDAAVRAETRSRTVAMKMRVEREEFHTAMKKPMRYAWWDDQ